MPELPEVETMMQGLAAVLDGKRIVCAVAHRTDLRWPLPKDFGQRLTGARIAGFRRRGKYMLMRLSTGESLLVHFGMSGRVVAQLPGAAAPPGLPQGRVSGKRGAGGERHEHVVIEAEDGTRLGFVDPRRFGAMDLVATASEEAHPWLAGMGPEPLGEGFSPAVLDAALAGRTRPIKPALLDQKVVAGLGNIYVAEALFRAGISPQRRAGTIPGEDSARLVRAIRDVLAEAIAAGGTSLRDYVQPDGRIGRFQERFAVYGREGKACPGCPGPPACPGILHYRQAGRASYACPRKQR